MGLRSDSKDIGHLRVTVTQLPVLRAAALLPRVGSIITSALEKMTLDAEDLQKMSAVKVGDMSISVLFPALHGVFKNLMTSGEFVPLIRDLNASTQVEVDGKIVGLTDERKIGSVFDGNLRLLIETTLFAIEVNYGDFFAGNDKAAEAASPAV